mgnify:CR=1 FL=1
MPSDESTVDGLGPPHILGTGAVSGADIGSGGIGLMHFATSAISGNVVASGGVGTQHLAANAGSGAVTPAAFPVCATGSPTGYGQTIQHGTVNTNAGSLLWVVFGTAFLAAPNVVVGGGPESVSTWFRAQTIVAGSVLIHSQAASSSGQWIAIGSGRV